MINVSIDVPASDVNAMNDTFNKYVAYFNGNTKKATEKTMVKLITALRAANTTMRSKDRRAIVAWHIPKQLAHGSRKFKADTYFAIDMLKQNGRSKKIPIPYAKHISSAKRIAEQMMPKAYFLKKPYGKQGLAQSSWSWMLKRLKKSAGAEQLEISNAVSVDKSDRISGGVQVFEITATNRLNYIRKALKSNVSTFMSRAQKMMVDEIEGHKKGASRAIGRAAA